MSELVTIPVTVHDASETHVLVSKDGDQQKAVRIPIEAFELVKGHRRLRAVTIPREEALAKGLL